MSSKVSITPNVDLPTVLNDIASTMFNKKFIHEIFLKHTPLYSKKVLRAMFDRLAHASIMRLNAGSMDKVIRSYVIQTRRKQGINLSAVCKVRKEAEMVKGFFTFECKNKVDIQMYKAQNVYNGNGWLILVADGSLIEHMPNDSLINNLNAAGC